MLRRINNYWNCIIFSGIGHVSSPHIKRKVMLTNQLSISVFLISIPIFFYFIFYFPRPIYLISNVAVMILCLLAPVFNDKGYFNLTRISLCVFTTLAPAVLSLIDKAFIIEGSIGITMYYNPRFYLMAAMVIPLLLIDLSEKGKLAGCLLLNVFFLFGFDWIDSLFGVGFFQRTHETPQYFFSNYHIAAIYIFLLLALLYLQFSNRRYEVEIIDLNKNLNQHVVEKTRELEGANMELAAFNFMISHELKTPLTAAQMITQSMKTLYKEKLGESGTEDLRTLNNCLVEMQKLIGSIMNFSKISQLSENIEVLDMNEIVDEVMNDFELIGIPENTKVVIKDLPVSKADRAMIKQVFSNLISNALKYSRKKDHAVVEIDGMKGESENIYFVKDNGIGFSMSDKQKLFSLFERLHSKADYEGSGLGLPIVERIVKRHGGRVWAEGEPGKGASIYFSLPA